MFVDEIAVTESPGSDDEKIAGLVVDDLDSSLSSVGEVLLSSAARDSAELKSVMEGVDAIGLGRIESAAGVVAANIPNILTSMKDMVIGYARAASTAGGFAHAVDIFKMRARCITHIKELNVQCSFFLIICYDCRGMAHEE